MGLGRSRVSARRIPQALRRGERGDDLGFVAAGQVFRAPIQSSPCLLYTSLEDSLVAFAERVRPTAEGHEPYAPMLDQVKRAEDALRSRDRVLAADQDAQTGRLASVDAQLSKLEADLAKAQAEERAVLTEIASSQGALSRAEAKAKRAESELRAAQRESDRSA